jgi:hypothetical protein
MLVGLAACTGSPATLALRPDFEVKTSAGVASVNIRESLPGMTDSAFETLVRTGMERAAPGSVLARPVMAPLPQRRIVWHVNPSADRGVSTLMVNIFDGSSPVVSEEEVVTDDAPMATITDAIASLTGRLIASYTHRDANAPADGPPLAL